MHRRVPGGGVGADADEGGLAERRQPADAGQQHETERGKRIDADVVHQRDGEGAEQRRRDRDERRWRDPAGCGTASASGVPLVLFLLDLFLDAAARHEGLPDQHGDERAEHQNFLERELLQNAA